MHASARRDLRCMAAQVSERYRSLWKSGLTQRGLEKTYEDGYGDVDNDYETLFWSEQVRRTAMCVACGPQCLVPVSRASPRLSPPTLVRRLLQQALEKNLAFKLSGAIYCRTTPMTTGRMLTRTSGRTL